MGVYIAPAAPVHRRQSVFPMAYTHSTHSATHRLVMVNTTKKTKGLHPQSRRGAPLLLISSVGIRFGCGGVCPAGADTGAAPPGQLLEVLADRGEAEAFGFAQSSKPSKRSAGRQNLSANEAKGMVTWL